MGGGGAFSKKNDKRLKKHFQENQLPMDPKQRDAGFFLIAMESVAACSSVCCAASVLVCFFFFSSRRRHARFDCDWSSDVCSSDLRLPAPIQCRHPEVDPRGVRP